MNDVLQMTGKEVMTLEPKSQVQGPSLRIHLQTQ